MGHATTGGRNEVAAAQAWEQGEERKRCVCVGGGEAKCQPKVSAEQAASMCARMWLCRYVSVAQYVRVHAWIGVLEVECVRARHPA